MYKIKKEKMQSLIERLQKIRSMTDEALKSLECVVSSQGKELSRDVNYNPDDYLKKWTNAPDHYEDSEEEDHYVDVFRARDEYEPDYLE